MNYFSESGLCFRLMGNSEVLHWKWFHYSYFSEYDMKENDGEFDEEDLEDNDMAIPRRYVEEDKIIFDSFGNLRGQMI